MNSAVKDVNVEIDSEAYLDNVVWASLDGAHAKYAQRHEGALKYRPEFAPFGAAQDYSEASVSRIAAMLGAKDRLALFTTRKPELPEGLEITRDALMIQMIQSRECDPPGDPRIVKLELDDAPSMLRLVALTEPGPFASRTNELGNFFGIREGGQLVAMAGERMIAGKYVEVSAVCTHPEFRGRGLGKALMQHVAASIQRRGAVPILHVFATNLAAIGLYREMGFRNGRGMWLTAVMGKGD
jgi:ribosomal protein S18 acetylase RimI-like enzyme